MEGDSPWCNGVDGSSDDGWVRTTFGIRKGDWIPYHSKVEIGGGKKKKKKEHHVRKHPCRVILPIETSCIVHPRDFLFLNSLPPPFSPVLPRHHPTNHLLPSSLPSSLSHQLRTPPRPRYSTTRSLLPHFGSPPASSMRTDIPGSSSDIDPQSSVGMSARRVGAINGNATNGDDGASPSSRRRGLRKRSGVEKEGKEIWLDDGGDDGDGDVKVSWLANHSLR